jgi:hypothetical protein
MDHPTTLSIIVPAFNERATIAEILRRVLAVEIPVVRQNLICDETWRDSSSSQRENGA